MSYTHLVKEEAMQKNAKSTKERVYELYAILKSKNAIHKDRIEVNLENIGVAKRVYSILKENTNLKIFVKYSISKRFGTHKVYSVIIPYQKNFKKLHMLFEKLEGENFLKSEKKINGYIKGMFLATGYIKDPEKEYALDFFIENEEDADILYEAFIKMDKKAFKTQKRNKYLVYLRNSEDILDILVLVGAMKSFFAYEEITLVKEIKNKTIRAINWEVANETKIINTAHKQIQMIKYVEEHLGLYELSDAVQEVCHLRLQYEEDSLKELAERIGISKSGIRGRFRRLEKIYNELIEKE